MSHANHVIEYAKKLMAERKKKEAIQSGIHGFIVLREQLNTIIERHEKLDATFKEVGLDGLWVECPECDSPVLLEMEKCPFCTTDLIGGEHVEEEKPKKKTKKKEVEPEPEEEEDETPEMAEDDIEIDEEEDEAPEFEDDSDDEDGEEPSDDDYEEDDEESEEEDEEEGLSVDDLPDEDDVMKMKKAELLKIIKEFDLDVDPKGLKIAELREKINDALDILADELQEESEEEDEEYDDEIEGDDSEDLDDEDMDEEEDEEGEDEEEDLDLDGINFDDIDDIDEMDDDEDED